MVHLWSGVSKDTESALQLLSIVDLIRFWVDYTYKPLIGACISRLEAMKANKEPPSMNCTLWGLRIAMDPEQTPWVFSQRRLKVASNLIGSTNNLGVSPHERRRCHFPSSRRNLRPDDQRFPGRGHRSPTLAGKRFVMPETDKFNWLLDRDPGEGDLILIRISEASKVMRPVIIHSTSRLVDGRRMPTVDWKDRGFKAVIADERRGHHSQVISIFREDRLGRDYLWQYYQDGRRPVCHGVQSSIILPVNVVSYGQQNPESQGAQLFKPLESLFRLHDLLRKIKRANRKWCSCGLLRRGDDLSREINDEPLFQCRNALCNVGWYHQKCVSFPDSDDGDSESEDCWVCDECRKTPGDIALLELKLEESDEFADASYDRLHLARAIETVWYKHDWPSQDEINAKIDEVVNKVDIIENATRTICEAGGRSGLDLPRYWAISKDDPKKLILACPRKESLLCPEAVSDEEDKHEDTNNVEGFVEETDDYTVYNDEDGLSRPKITKARGRSKSVDRDHSIYVERDIATGSEGDALVLRTPNKTSKSGQSRRKSSPKVKHVREKRRSAKPRSLSR